MTLKVTEIINPLVSICIPTYNGTAFIAQAMESIITQSYSNLEVIVSDDNSKDNTLSIIEDYKSKIKAPIFIFNHEPNGIGANWNNCVKKAKGKYIKFLFQDDLLAPQCIEKMVEQAEKNQQIGLVYSARSFIYNPENIQNINWIKKYGALHTHWKHFEIASNKTYKGEVLLKDDYLLSYPKNKIGEPTAVLLRKDVFDKVGLFSTTLKQALDVEYWYRVMKYYDVLFINEKLVSFRLHDNQASHINANNNINEIELLDRSIYQYLFWKLSLKNKLKLFSKYNNIGIIIHKMISKIKKGF